MVQHNLPIAQLFNCMHMVQGLSGLLLLTWVAGDVLNVTGVLLLHLMSGLVNYAHIPQSARRRAHIVCEAAASHAALDRHVLPLGHAYFVRAADVLQPTISAVHADSPRR